MNGNFGEKLFRFSNIWHCQHRRWLRSTCFSSSANRLNQSILGLYSLSQPQKPTTDTQHRTRLSAKAINVSGWPIQALPLIFWISATALNDAIAINNLWKYSNLLSNKPKRRNYLVQFGSTVHRGVVVVLTRFRSSFVVLIAFRRHIALFKVMEPHLPCGGPYWGWWGWAANNCRSWHCLKM